MWSLLGNSNFEKESKLVASYNNEATLSWQSFRRQETLGIIGVFEYNESKLKTDQGSLPAKLICEGLKDGTRMMKGKSFQSPRLNIVKLIIECSQRMLNLSESWYVDLDLKSLIASLGHIDSLLFTTIVNELVSLGKIYTTEELVDKVLRTLPKSWEIKVTAIREAKDLTTMSLDELVGNLKTYELNVDETKMSGRNKDMIFSFKATESDEYNLDDEGIVMISKNLKKLFKKDNSNEDDAEDMALMAMEDSESDSELDIEKMETDLEKINSDLKKENQFLKEQVQQLDSCTWALKSEILKQSVTENGKGNISGDQIRCDKDLKRLKDELFSEKEISRRINLDLTRTKYELERANKWTRSLMIVT
ncbi:hypothetical protein H5410_022695 [Solanum commersonii]|uniref:Uncharacterized protein n=1 Tax=Solanum commersonii TaxID=4109 RepID=A0A9J5ZJL7_SOLCO|nr:hypothetical protein H5410_022695 [Solanum commersonii]